VWWIIGAVAAWIVLSIPIAILIGKAAAQKDVRERPEPASGDGLETEPPDGKVA
jgi:glycerol-3-phosphate acyltransferase PlsY